MRKILYHKQLVGVLPGAPLDPEKNYVLLAQDETGNTPYTVRVSPEVRKWIDCQDPNEWTPFCTVNGYRVLHTYCLSEKLYVMFTLRWSCK